MRYLFLDPSSKAIGWCLTKDRKVVRANRVVGSKGTLPEKLNGMMNQLEALLCEVRPDVIVLERPSGKVNPKRHGGGGSGLSVYGVAVGRVWQKCVDWARWYGDRKRSVETVTEAWTGGHDKEKRRRVALKAYPKLAELHDPGRDISDAIAMAVMWFAKKNGGGKKRNAEVH